MRPSAADTFVYEEYLSSLINLVNPYSTPTYTKNATLLISLE